jgi:CheY-like chemotaxis protein
MAEVNPFKKRILLAARSSSVERIIVGILAGHQVEITAVTDGYAAERSLGLNQYDLVLADVFLLGKNGYELCHSVRQDPRFSSLPVVLLVDSFEPFDAAAAAKLGADGKLTKPIEPAGLLDIVRRFLGDCSAQPNETEPIPSELPRTTGTTDFAGDADDPAHTASGSTPTDDRDAGFLILT